MTLSKIQQLTNKMTSNCFNFCCTISNFSSISTQKKINLSGLKHPKLVNLYFALSPKQSVLGTEECISLILCSNVPLENTLKLNCEIGFIGTNGGKHGSREILFKIPTNKMFPICGGAYFFNRDYLFDPQNGLLVDGNLNIQFQIKIQEQEFIDQANQTEMVIENLNSLLGDDKFSDAIVVVGGQEFSVHKAILCSRSAVFGAMFTHDCEENTNRVTIIDMTAEVFEYLLDYIYTGLIPPMKELVWDIYVAADKYQLESLKKFCEQSMSSSLSVDSVANVLLIADMHNSLELKSKCIKYINQNANEVMATDGWNELKKNRGNLIIEMYEIGFTKTKSFSQ